MSTESGNILLVIHDNPQVSQELVNYLTAAGYAVHTESSSQASLRWFAESPPAAVLTTLHSPDNPTSSLLADLKVVRGEVPVIVLAQEGILSDSVQALREGAADYIVAPLDDREKLLDAVGLAINAAESERRRFDEITVLEKSNQELQDYVRLLERDHQAAQRVQEKLLPRTPVHFDGFKLEHRIVPSLILSGDFIDYGLFEQRWLSFYLTDVSGHGASSAFVTMWLKQLIRRLFREKRFQQAGDSREIDVAQFIAKINSELVHSRFGCHLTCFVGIIDLKTREMRYVLGGHLPLPILITQGETRYLEGKGKPLGLFTGAHWKVYKTQLVEPFSLVVFSDGVLEILPPTDLLEKEALLLEMVRESGGEMSQIYARFKLDSKLEAPDDIAVLTVNAGDVS